MKLLSTFLLMFLAISGGSGDHSAQKRGLFDLDLGGLVDDIFGGLKNLVTGVISGIKDAATTVVAGVNDVVTALTADLATIVKLSHEFLHDVVNTFVKRYDSVQDKVVRPVIDQFNKVLTTIDAKLSEAITGCQTKVDSMLVTFYSTVKQVTSDGFNGIMNLVQGVSDKISKSAKKFQDCVNTHMPKVEKFANDQVNNFRSCINKNIEAVKAEVIKMNNDIKKATGAVKKIADDADVCLRPLLKLFPGMETFKTAAICLEKVIEASARLSVDLAKDLIELSEGVVANIALATKNVALCKGIAEKDAFTGTLNLEKGFETCCSSS